jgi:hypothetical protein
MTDPARTSAPDKAVQRELEGIMDTVDEGDRPSITEVNGTVARFTMAYNLTQGQKATFGPPTIQRIPAYIYFAFTVLVVIVVAAAHLGSSNSALFVWVVEGDRGRPLGSTVLAFLIFASGLGTLVRSYLRGVVVSTEGLEGRYLLPLGVPKVKKWAWPQIHRMIIDERQVMLELWDGSYERLPDVGQPQELRATLEGVAASRKITITKLK